MAKYWARSSADDMRFQIKQMRRQRARPDDVEVDQIDVIRLSRQELSVEAQPVHGIGGGRQQFDCHADLLGATGNDLPVDRAHKGRPHPAQDRL